MDPEIEAMSAIANALSELDDQSRARVLRWAADKFNVVVSTSKPAISDKNNQGTKDVNEEIDAQEEESNNDFDSFAEFFATAAPSSEADKVLVAGYWFQKKQGHADLTSAFLNKELKHLGHSIAGINQKFDTLMSAKPQLAIQLKKSGSSKQARKKYKITQAGISKVEQMLGI